MAAPDTAPVPLHLPAILQNPINASQRQVEAHNAQQRERAAARRAQREDTMATGSTRGKRFTRRKDNAAFAGNPHVVAPRRSDFYPPVPLQYHPQRRSDIATLPRSEKAPSVSLERPDPTSKASVDGAFSTSLKGTRAMLRKRGRRAETLVTAAEGNIRRWLSGDWPLVPQEEKWATIDPHVPQEGQAEVVPSTTSDTSASPPSGHSRVDRRVPAMHRPRPTLPALPAPRPAVIELSRSPAHLSWAIADPFERLVIHLLCRYYELITFSENHATVAGERIRLTHIVRPALTRPALPMNELNRAGFTPENSDLSALSASDDSKTAVSTETETETAVGDDTASEYSVEGFSLEGPSTLQDWDSAAGATPLLDSAMDRLALERVSSASSSAYAGSEGGSDMSDLDVMVNSLTLPPLAHSQGDDGSYQAAMPARSANNARPALRRITERTWEEKPTFFDYLYGE